MKKTFFFGGGFNMRRFLTGIIVAALVLSTPLTAKVKADEGLLIDEQTFPDAGFRSYLSTREIDKNADKVLDRDEIAQATKIFVNEIGISSLEGIQYFTELEELSCSNNNLTAIDLNSNTKLKILNCGKNGLTSLDLKNNKNLEEVDCTNNKLENLDISNNTLLKKLYAINNKLTGINLNNNSMLEELYVDVNYISNIDLKDNVNLVKISCGVNELTEIDFSNNTKLEVITCDSNKLTNVDISRCENVKSTNFESNIGVVELDENDQIDLATLPGSFDTGKAGNWTSGCTVKDNILTVEKGISEIYYDYNIGQDVVVNFCIKIANRQASEDESKNEAENMTSKGDETTQSSNGASTKKPKVSKVSKVKVVPAKKKLKVSWKKTVGAAGYQLQISPKKKFKKVKIRTVKAKARKYTFKKLKSKKNYYVRIRAYATYKDGSKKAVVYGKWTTVRKKVK